MRSGWAKCLWFLAIWLPAQLYSQSIPPKHEFRAVWVCTLANLDWPSKAGLSAEAQKLEMLKMLDRFESLGLNAVVLQVRPAGDAFYPSKFAPWSHYLTGKPGHSPDPWYDPLQFVIEECHKRNLELHAWFNPFRAISHIRHVPVSPKHLSKQHPEYCFDYGVTRYFDPGLPQVRAHVLGAILEVLRNYDVDGIHLDDYFYPYPLAGQKIGDDRSYSTYGRADYPNIADWRRHNTDLFIEALHDSIAHIKPWVRFGVSPFGVWRNLSEDPRGSETKAFTAYDGLYADTRKWISNGWVDYLAPQLYWSLDHPRASYRKLLTWWDGLETDRDVFVGHAPYLMDQQIVPAWARCSEFLTQIELRRQETELRGDLWFRGKTLMGNAQEFCDRLSGEAYQYRALSPPLLWRDSIGPGRPEKFVTVPVSGGVQLVWEPALPGKDGEGAAYYVVYRFEEDDVYNRRHPRHIVAVTRETAWFDRSVSQGKGYAYVVTAVDRSHNESARYAYFKVYPGLEADSF